MYTPERIIHSSQLDSYEKFISPLLNSGLPVFPDFNDGVWLFRNDKNEKILSLSTKNFIDIMFTISQFVQSHKNTQFIFQDLINHLKNNLALYADQSNLSDDDFIERLKLEYLYISSPYKNILIPLFDQVNGNYVKTGILHFLLYHYNDFKNSFAKQKIKTLFKEPVTINELLGFLIILIDSVNTNSRKEANRQIIEKVIECENYRLIIEPKSTCLDQVVSFYRVENKSVIFFIKFRICDFTKQIKRMRLRLVAYIQGFRRTA